MVNRFLSGAELQAEVAQHHALLGRVSAALLQHVGYSSSGYSRSVAAGRQLSCSCAHLLLATICSQSLHESDVMRANSLPQLFGCNYSGSSTLAESTAAAAATSLLLAAVLKSSASSVGPDEQHRSQCRHVTASKPISLRATFVPCILRVVACISETDADLCCHALCGDFAALMPSNRKG